MHRKVKFIALSAGLFVSAFLCTLVLTVHGTLPGTTASFTASSFDVDRVHRASVLSRYGGWMALAVGLFCVWRLMLKHVKYALAITPATVLAAVLIAVPLAVLLGLAIYPKAEFLWQPYLGGTLALVLTLGIVHLFAGEKTHRTNVASA